MNSFQLHPDFYNRPIQLSPGEQTKPMEILRNFFDNCPLATVRKTLWQMVETALAVPYSVYDNAGERQSLLWFYRELEMALEAGWLLSQRNGENQ